MVSARSCSRDAFLSTGIVLILSLANIVATIATPLQLELIGKPAQGVVDKLKDTTLLAKRDGDCIGVECKCVHGAAAPGYPACCNAECT